MQAPPGHQQEIAVAVATNNRDIVAVLTFLIADDGPGLAAIELILRARRQQHAKPDCVEQPDGLRELIEIARLKPRIGVVLPTTAKRIADTDLASVGCELPQIVPWSESGLDGLNPVLA